MLMTSNSISLCHLKLKILGSWEHVGRAQKGGFLFLPSRPKPLLILSSFPGKLEGFFYYFFGGGANSHFEAHRDHTDLVALGDFRGSQISIIWLNL